MQLDRELIVYGRTTYCPYLDTAHTVLAEYKVPYREIMIDLDPDAAARVIAWTGFRSVPTLLVAESGQEVPAEEPSPLERGTSPRGIDRGSMITEANADELIPWLKRHGFIGG
jgi:glutaredoxin